MSINLSALQKQRRDTAANWTAEDPTLLAGEIGVESDTGYWKIGDGATAWTSLAYLPGTQLSAYPLVDADIAAAAEIAVSKLADGAARQLLQTDAAGTGVEWTDNVDVPGTLDVTGTGTFDGNVTIAGDLTVNGTTTTINTQDLLVEDKNIIIGNVTTPSDVTADGGGITLKGTTDKTINWVDSTDAWTLSEHVDLGSGKEYRINGTKVLDATSLGSGVVSSSLTSVGTIGTGVWQGTAIDAAYLDSTVVTTGDTGTVTSTMIADGTIVDADVNASAAIAGTKISPDFGAQNVTTTGTSTAASFIPTSSTVPTNGVYLPAANSVALSTNSSGRIHIGSTGTVNIVGAGTAGSTQAVSFNGSAPVNSVVLDSSGRLGIGTSSPSALLQVGQGAASIYTDFAINGATTANYGPKISLQHGGSEIFEIANYGRVQGGTSSDVLVETVGSNKLQLGTNRTVALTIDTSQRVGIGTTGPSYQLELSTDSAGKPSTNTWTIVSDERIKEEIELADLDLCYEAVKNIPLKRFKWKDEVYTEEQAYDRRKLGWIAQDVEAVFPKAVRQHEFKYNQVFEEVVIPAVPAELDDDGNIITEEQPERIEKGELISEEVIEDCRDLNSDQLYAAMYGAIQKLISKVELLEAEVQTLKGL